MASKNEIKHRISLEGDEDVKRRLQAVGEAGKQSMGDIEKRLDGAKRGAGGKPAAALSEAVSPLADAAGLAGVAGMFGRLSSSLLSPAGLVAGLTTALLGMAKLGEETERQKGRLKSLGDSDGFAKVSDQAKKLGTDVSRLQGRYEKFISAEQEQNAKNKTIIHPPNFVPGGAQDSASSVRVLGAGPSTSPPARGEFQAFDRALFEQIRRDVGDSDQAHQITGQFEDGIKKDGLTGDALRALQQAAPSAAKFITDSLSQKLGRGFSNPNELAAHLDRGNAQVGGFDVIREGAKKAPEADKEAQAARGVTDAFEGLQAATKRLAETMGGDHAGLTKGIDTAAGLVNKGAEATDNFLHASDRQSGGKEFIGPVRPEDDLSKPPSSFGEVFSSDKGDLLGRLVGYLRGGATGEAKGPLEIQGGNPLGVITSGITDFVTKALGGATDGTSSFKSNQPFVSETNRNFSPTPQVQAPPNPQEKFEYIPPPSPEEQRRLDRSRANGPEYIPPPPQQHSSTDQPDIASNAAALTEAMDSATGATQRFASAIGSVGTDAKSNSPTTTEKFADGGSVQHFADGGHIRGAGTATSDSIPAMLSDGEFVINTRSAQKIGRRNLDWLNSGAPGFAQGGDVGDGIERLKRLAAGGDAASAPGGLSPGPHSIQYDPGTGGAYIDGNLHLPGDPVLEDPEVKAAIQRSKVPGRPAAGQKKHKSDFVGVFGGHVFDTPGGYATGGAVGSIPTLRSHVARFASGGAVPRMNIDSLSEAAPDVSGLAASSGSSPWADMPHLGSMDLRSDHGEARVMGSADALRSMTAAARDSSNSRIGRAPSWYRGR